MEASSAAGRNPDAGVRALGAAPSPANVSQSPRTPRRTSLCGHTTTQRLPIRAPSEAGASEGEGGGGASRVEVPATRHVGGVGGVAPFVLSRLFTTDIGSTVQTENAC